MQSNIELFKNKCTNCNGETKLNERENNNTSENAESNQNNSQTILEHNKHDYIKTDPKASNDNQVYQFQHILSEI